MYCGVVCKWVNIPDFIRATTVDVHFRYLHQVIDETLRCSVLAPWAARYQDFDSELGGHKIPKNVRCSVLHKTK